jgi:hypothetical protein
MSQSPLAEANPESLQEIFDKDPLKLTDDDIERVVAEERAMREKWKASERAGSTRKPPKQEVPNLSLDDLGL